MASPHDLTLKRTLNAPIETVWEAWTDQEQLKEWWGPNGVTNPTCVWEAKVGGKINIVMLAGPNMGPFSGKEWPMTGEFVEVEPPHKLVYNSSPTMDGEPIFDQTCTVLFEADGDKTTVTLNIEITRTTPDAEGPLSNMEAGFNQQLDKMVSYAEEAAER